jgi:hypothetical protein
MTISLDHQSTPQAKEQPTIPDYEARKVETLLKYGCPESLLWLTECHSVDSLSKWYGKEAVSDLGLKDDDFGVVYWHESGSIMQLAGFSNSDESFEKACAYVGSQMKGCADDE